MKELIKNLPIWAIATDPIYIGTGGYTIGRVDNTIVRDPVTRIPKIPGSSLAGTWRYYVALYLQSLLRDEYRLDRNKRKGISLNELFNFGQDRKISNSQQAESWLNFEGNRYAAIKCAGQDESPQSDYDEDIINNTGHCGHCVVCKGFGFSKADFSWQGTLFFSDLNILFFPVYTRLGVKWITTERIIKEAGLFRETPEVKSEREHSIIAIYEKATDETGWLNLGWLNLPYKRINAGLIDFNSLAGSFPDINEEDICIVPENLITQIINSNLEVRTSVSIDPLTGAAKDGALFTSEAIPRATTFYGNIRIFDKSMFSGCNKKIGELPSAGQLKAALKDTSHFYETLGIGGMTTRGFGRLRINIDG
jgi:CRISPR-associated protein Cmr4